MSFSFPVFNIFLLNYSIGFLPPPSLHFCLIPLFQWVRLGLEARGSSAAAREGERGTKLKGGGRGPEIQFWGNPYFLISLSFPVVSFPVIYSVGETRKSICFDINCWLVNSAGEPEPEPVGAGCFWLLAGAGAAWKKKSRSRLEKSQEPEPEAVKISRILSPARR